MPRRNKVYAIPREIEVEPDTRLKLRCWLDREGDLHIAGDEAGATALLDAVTALRDGEKPKSIALPLVDSPIPEEKNPVPRRGVVKIFRELRLERIDDPDVVKYIYAGPAGSTAEIKLAPQFIGQFLVSCMRMREGFGDFSIGLESVGISKHRRKRLQTLDRETTSVWFWGPVVGKHTHGVNTF